MSTDRPPTNVPPPTNQNFDRRHRFMRGHRKLGGRRKGTPNVTTKLVKDAMLGAMEILGEDGKGKNGLTGYFVSVAKKDPVELAKMAVARLMPVQEAEKSRQELEQTDWRANVRANITEADDEL